MATNQRGRRPDANSKSGKVRELLATGMSASDIAKQVGCTTALVYNVKAALNRKDAGRRGAKRGRPKATAAAADGLASLLAAVQGVERERTQLRQALEKMQAVVAGALA